MNFARRFPVFFTILILAFAYASFTSTPSRAQQDAEVIEVVPVEEGGTTAESVEQKSVTPEHLEAAKAAMRATGASARLDRILPEIAAFTKTGLITNRPDIEQEISTIVDEVAISMAARRAPLEEEVAKIYTQAFSEAELREIETFFAGEAGIKFLRFTPVLFKQIDRISGVWRTGITRDLSREVQVKMNEQGLQ